MTSSSLRLLASAAMMKSSCAPDTQSQPHWSPVVLADVFLLVAYSLGEGQSDRLHAAPFSWFVCAYVCVVYGCVCVCGVVCGGCVCVVCGGVCMCM